MIKALQVRALVVNNGALQLGLPEFRRYTQPPPPPNVMFNIGHFMHGLYGGECLECTLDFLIKCGQF